MRQLLLATLLFSVFGLAQQHPVQTSICAISKHPSRFQNKFVAVRAAALGGEVQILMETKDGNLNRSCGRIWLDLDSVKSDSTTQKFLRLFKEQLPKKPCGTDKDVLQDSQHALDPNVPASKPCDPSICIFCPRYRIVATFIGKLRDSEMGPGKLGFGHLNGFRLQLELQTVTDMDVKDAPPNNRTE